MNFIFGSGKGLKRRKVPALINQLFGLPLSILMRETKISSYKGSLFKLNVFSIFNYYINTNEVPGEFSRENLVSSPVEITCYLT